MHAFPITGPLLHDSQSEGVGMAFSKEFFDMSINCEFRFFLFHMDNLTFSTFLQSCNDLIFKAKMRFKKPVENSLILCSSATIR